MHNSCLLLSQLVSKHFCILDGKEILVVICSEESLLIYFDQLVEYNNPN